MYSNYTSKARRKIDILLHKRSCEKLLSVCRQGSRKERGERKSARDREKRKRDGNVRTSRKQLRISCKMNVQAIFISLTYLSKKYGNGKLGETIFYLHILIFSFM